MTQPWPTIKFRVELEGTDLFDPEFVVWLCRNGVLQAWDGKGDHKFGYAATFYAETRYALESMIRLWWDSGDPDYTRELLARIEARSIG